MHSQFNNNIRDATYLCSGLKAWFESFYKEKNGFVTKVLGDRGTYMFPLKAKTTKALIDSFDHKKPPSIFYTFATK